MTKPITIGIMGAMPEEITGITALIENRDKVVFGGRTYHRGTINGINVVVVFSRWGKVAAASTATTLLLEFGADELIFTGVAGALHPELRIGDIVIGRRLFQHDMDARPMLRRFEIPLIGMLYFECNSQHIKWVKQAAEKAMQPNKYLKANIVNSNTLHSDQHPKIYVGDIASGDKFISGIAEKQEIIKILPEVLCVEMEGAAVAQVCHEFGVQWTIIRVISDRADELAQVDFQSFIRDVSTKNIVKIIKEILTKKKDIL
jgi:adenosylhomocysteine nucleosidase